ncbi:PREDICTED: rust resistance kinase Lr10-like [Ipomoea nil]|uniref:rust resistance kinase Lr10-like n=1 Tax=Ipomoea nil TaxID=35883 RepID=UPI0009018FC8|nr:PREDICTED: rust resistance kinase Lr10-like [Ipomoea nil]
MAALRVLRICSVILMSCLVWCSTNCRALQQHTNCSSSCGTIQNIQSPFRLAGDPNSCGHPDYQLSCVQNRTFLPLNSKQYLVLSINYGNFTIRILDPGLERNNNNNCSPFPHYTLMDVGDVPPQYLNPFWAEAFPTISEINNPVIFIVCRNPARSTLYVNIDASGFCGNNYSLGYSHSYALVGDGDEWARNKAIVGNLEDSCAMIGVAWISSSLSFHQLRDALAWGFDLPWFRFNCSAECLHKHDRDCRYDYISAATTCFRYGYYCSLQLKPFEFRLTPQCLKYIWQNEQNELRRLIGAIASGRFLLGLLFLFSIVLYKLRRRHLSAYHTIEEYLNGPNNHLMPIRYTYSDLKKMTNNFKHKLGEGGYGIVFKGTLRSGPFVAVKMMGKSKANAQDFISEVGTIGRIHHTNVVRLIGFCVEGSKHALIYEFMPNGSLDKYIFSKEESRHSLSYDKMFEICIGVARGIDYLHRGCDMRILHFDIKPHNVLLDENFSPKISDFGLAKLYSTKDSIVPLTAARGTMGYMAPELFYRSIGGISHKADVYSFGMLLMEMGGRRKNLNPMVEHTSQNYFPSWVYERFKDGKDMDMDDATEVEKKVVKKMIIAAFWCIQMKPSDRPSMNEVVEMLEGDVEVLEMPPRPFLCADDLPTDDDEITTSTYTESTELSMLSGHPMRSDSL